MPPQTRSKAKQQRWSRLGLPNELLDDIIHDVVGEHLHSLFTLAPSTISQISKTPRMWNGIRTLLHVSRQYRALTSTLILKLIYRSWEYDDHDPLDPTPYEQLHRSMFRIRDLRETFCCQRRVHDRNALQLSVEIPQCLQSLHLNRRCFRLYYRLNSGGTFLHVPEGIETHEWGRFDIVSWKGDARSHPDCGTVESSDKLLWRGYRSLAQQTHRQTLEMVLGIVENYIMDIQRVVSDSAEGKGECPSDSYFDKRYTAVLELIAEFETRWRKLAAIHHYKPTHATLQEALRHSISQSRHLVSAVAIAESYLTIRSRPTKHLLKAITVIDKIQLAFDLGKEPGKLLFFLRDLANGTFGAVLVNDILGDYEEQFHDEEFEDNLIQFLWDVAGEVLK